MKKTGKNYRVSSVGDIQTLGRVTLKDELALTGSEISVNELPAGVSVPFVHSHKRNEEVYIILKGKGQFYIDGEEFEVEEGSVIRVDPAAARCLRADGRMPIRYACIQTEANSLVQFTRDDGVVLEVKPRWLK
jgi:mannose-6-phosphate isomerase-like protein (cupin superfamily)